MSSSPSLATRLIFGLLRGFLAVFALSVAFVATGFLIVPLAILVPPLPVILAGLLVLYVFAATDSMANRWHEHHGRNRVRRSPASVSSVDLDRRPPPVPIRVER